MRDNTQRAQYATLMIWIILGLEVLTLLSSYLQIGLLQQVMDGEFVSDQRINSNDLREGVIGVLYTLAFIVSTVTFIRWFRRAYYNLHLQVGGLESEENMAAIGWFIPFVNLFRPYQIMRELYRETARWLSARQLGQTTSPNLTLIGIWWFLWVLNNFIANLLFRTTMNITTAEDLLYASQVSMGTAVLGIILCLVTVQVIQQYAAMEQEMYRLASAEASTSMSDLEFRADEDILDAFQ